MATYLAQEIHIGGTKITGPLVGLDGKEINTVADILNILLSFIYPLAGLLLFFFLVWGGFGFLTSRGDPEKVKSARAKITSALIGFILLVISFFFVKVISFVFRLGDGLFN